MAKLKDKMKLINPLVIPETILNVDPKSPLTPVVKYFITFD